MTISRHLIRILSGLLTMASAVLPASTLAAALTIGGVGSLTPLIKQLGDEFAKAHPGFAFTVIEPPMGSNGGIRALYTGKIDLVVSARDTRPGETGLAKPWLQTPLVLATAGGKSKGVTRAQIADIYAGRKTTWDDDKPIRLVLRGDHETETKVLRALTPEIDVAVGESLKRPGLPLAENDFEALEMLGKIAGSFGTSSLGLIKASNSRLTILPIDGVNPSAKTIEDGSYPLRRQFYLITAPNPSPAVAAFVSWLNSPLALKTCRKLEFLPFKP